MTKEQSRAAQFHLSAQLRMSRQNAAAARLRMQNAPLNSGAWYDARASLQFWESRAAVFTAGGFANIQQDPTSQRREHA